MERSRTFEIRRRFSACACGWTLSTLSASRLGPTRLLSVTGPCRRSWSICVSLVVAAAMSRLTRLAAIASAEPTASQIVEALSIVSAGRADDAEAEKLATALEADHSRSTAISTRPLRWSRPSIFRPTSGAREISGGWIGAVADDFRASWPVCRRRPPTNAARLAGLQHGLGDCRQLSHRAGADGLPRCAGGGSRRSTRSCWSTTAIRPARWREIEAPSHPVARSCRVTGGGENRGFAAGVNLGVQKSAIGDRLLVLNPDAVLQPGSVRALEAARVQGAEPMRGWWPHLRAGWRRTAWRPPPPPDAGHCSRNLSRPVAPRAAASGDQEHQPQRRAGPIRTGGDGRRQRRADVHVARRLRPAWRL